MVEWNLHIKDLLQTFKLITQVSVFSIVKVHSIASDQWYKESRAHFYFSKYEYFTVTWRTEYFSLSVTFTSILQYALCSKQLENTFMVESFIRSNYLFLTLLPFFPSSSFLSFLPSICIKHTANSSIWLDAVT